MSKVTYERCHLVQGGQAGEDLFCGYSGCAVRPQAGCETVKAGGWPGCSGATPQKRQGCPSHHLIAGWWWSADVPRTTQACMASCVSEGRDRAHLSCAAIPIVTPGSYRRGRLLLWVFGVDDLPAVFLSTSSSSTCSRLGSGLPWFLRFSPRRDFSLRPRGSSCGCWSPQTPLKTLVGAVVRHHLLEVFVVVDHSSIFTLFFWTSRRACILAVFYGISELRSAHQEERFAQCSFRHLRQVVFHLAGSLGVFLRFAAP